MAKKSINKRIIWLIIWTTVTWVAGGLATTKKWKEVVSKSKDSLLDKVAGVFDFMSDGLKEMKKNLWDDKKNEDDG